MNTGLLVKIICIIFVYSVKLDMYKMFICKDSFAVIDFFTSIGLACVLL